MGIMGKVYVWLDKRVAYTEEEVSEVLGVKIDEDLQKCSRRELCRRVEHEFKLGEDEFWNLDSTQKIRFAVQSVRNMKGPSKFDMGY
tara:strand:+ start:211 stop:471 length:261 start_codon:yes stop_codon:yes gene_type:complete